MLKYYGGIVHDYQNLAEETADKVLDLIDEYEELLESLVDGREIECNLEK